MRKDILAKKVMCSVLALGMLSAANTALANSGGELRMWIKKVPIVGTRVMHDYIGVLTDGCNNLVTIDDGTENGKDINYVYGTYIDKSEYAEAYNNKVIVEAGTIVSNRNFEDGIVYGAYLENGRAESNSVLVRGTGNVEAFVYGAWVNTGTADNNKVILDGGIVGDEMDQTGGEIYGARVVDGSARNNIIVIKSGSVFADSVGAWVTSGYATNNIAIINDGLSNCVQGAFVEKGTAETNVAVMNGGEVHLGIRGGYSHTASNNNMVLVNDGYIGNSGGVSLVKDGAIGGFVDLSTGGIANYNSISVIGGTISNTGVYGGYIIESDAYDTNITDNGAKTIGNSVSISGGEIDGNVYGGCIQGGGTVKDNSIAISGGTVEGDVYGGYVTSKGTISNNVITLSGTANVSQANLYGGYIKDADGTVSGNKLIINGWSGAVNSLNKFDNMDFENIGKETVVKVNDLENTNVTNTVLNVKSVNRDEKIQIGDEIKITLEGLEAEDFADVKISDNGILQGVATAIQGDLQVNKNAVSVDVTGIAAHSQTAITTESRAAAAAFVNQGAAVVADSISSLQNADAGISTFATVSGNNSKYDTGSYVDINGWNSIIGVANTKEINAGKFSYGAFFENGSGNYNTYNDFNGTSFRGDGNAVYNGGGLLMRYEDAGGVYTEASLRAGTAKNEVSNVLSDGSGNLYGYKTENAYYGAHIGIGKIFKLDNDRAWDVYGKYFHTHHEGDSVTVVGDVFDFDSVDSDKLRIGARFSEQQSDKLSSYYGLAWEYEFSGDAGGTAAEHAMYTPSLEGSTVIGEIGFRYTPGKESPWYFDANVKGYVGMQEGISGSVQAVYSF